MSLDANLLQAALIAGLLGVAAFIALLADYLKSYNDQLRLRNMELATRQQERDRWFGASPDAFVEKIATMLRSAPGLPVAAPAANAPTVVAANDSSVQAAEAAEPDMAQSEPLGLAATPEAEPPVAPPVPERRPRVRGRRETARVESWVSKEELEKLAERAARIRARYGAMTGEDAANEESRLAPVAAVVPVPAPPVPKVEMPASKISQVASWTGSETQPQAHELATPPPQSVYRSPSEIFEQRDQAASLDHYDGRLSESVAGQPTLVHPAKEVARRFSPLEPVPEIVQPADAQDEAANEEAADSGPVWEIPASPAQARISQSVRAWENDDSKTEAPAAPATGLSVVPSYPSSQPAWQPASQPALQPMAALRATPADVATAPQLSQLSAAAQEARLEVTSQPYDSTGEYDAARAAASGEVDLDALFDQTYGSPSWLALNESESSAAHDSALPTGLFEGQEFTELMTEAPAFSGIAVSIRINDYAAVKPKLGSVEGIEAMNGLSNLIRSLLREDRDFAGRAQEDEYVLLFPGEIGDEGQRRLFHLSERLWDFQLRSLGGLALMLSWGGIEVQDEPVSEAVAAARGRLEESRRGRAKPGATFRSARRVS